MAEERTPENGNPPIDDPRALLEWLARAVSRVETKMDAFQADLSSTKGDIQRHAGRIDSLARDFTQMRVELIEERRERADRLHRLESAESERKHREEMEKARADERREIADQVTESAQRSLVRRLADAGLIAAASTAAAASAGGLITFLWWLIASYLKHGVNS